MRAYILSIGSELLLGHITDTNATFLAQELTASGIDLIHVTSTGDDFGELVDTMRHALTKADVVICSGGIGPTDDDLTREAIAEVVGETPEIDAELLDTLKGFFAGRGQAMPERNAKQAWRIPSSEILANPVGTAPGWFVQIPGDPPKYVVTMPGVPREMFRMWKEQALPRIRARAGQHVIDTIVIKTIGIGESAAEQELHDLVVAGNPIVATYAKDDGVHVMVSAIGDDVAETRERRDHAVAEVDRILGQYRWGTDTDTLGRVLASSLGESGSKLGILERGTGGAFAGLLARDQVSQSILAKGATYPIATGLSDGDAGQQADIDAEEALGFEGASIGVGLVFAGKPIENNLMAGRLTLAVARPHEKTKQLPGAMHRATLDEIQRRASLHAVDMLRREFAPVASEV